MKKQMGIVVSNPKSMKTILCRIAVVAFSLQAGQSLVLAQCTTLLAQMPAKYKLTQGSPTVGPFNVFFTNVVYTPGCGTYCASNHLTPAPASAQYEHAHLPAHFPFPHGADLVYGTNSDMAWAVDYASQTFVSGSTFAMNCYGYAAGTPTVTFVPGYTAFTDSSLQCSNTTKVKSFDNGSGSHVIVIDSIYQPETGDCLISTTREKNGSGPVYKGTWLPTGYAPQKAVRQRKL